MQAEVQVCRRGVRAEVQGARKSGCRREADGADVCARSLDGTWAEIYEIGSGESLGRRKE